MNGWSRSLDAFLTAAGDAVRAAQATEHAQPHLNLNGRIVVENRSPWLPYPAELVCEVLRWDIDQVRVEFGDTVLIRVGLTGVEFRRGSPDPDRVRAEVAGVIAEARAARPRITV